LRGKEKDTSVETKGRKKKKKQRSYVTSFWEKNGDRSKPFQGNEKRRKRNRSITRKNQKERQQNPEICPVGEVKGKIKKGKIQQPTEIPGPSVGCKPDPKGRGVNGEDSINCRSLEPEV